MRGRMPVGAKRPITFSGEYHNAQFNIAFELFELVGQLPNHLSGECIKFLRTVEAEDCYTAKSLGQNERMSHGLEPRC